MYQKLKTMIDFGNDIEFDLNGVMYTIIPWSDGKALIGRQGTDEEAIFQNGKDLLENYYIDGQPLKHYVNQITIIFSS